MNIEISSFHLELLLQHASEMGALCALTKVGKVKPYLKKSEAFRIYGRANVELWIERGLITPRKDGSDSAAWRIDRMELEAICRAKILLRYL
ncbi:hypothetical protein [Desertivirga xinjiangensis]|uniref:hypothetical protein n=1 Tax=Desertivirga xinjiangensis TaxID=539206 RepID=UPI00210A36D9|nr:hypothetical protein [Pedobacter xinjiangensis]